MSEDIAAEALEVANEISRVMDGYSTAACFAAISMLVGHAATLGKTPDLPGLLKLIEQGARTEFERRMTA